MTNTRAALWMIGAIISFTSMAIAGRIVSKELDTFEIMLYRSIIGFFIVITVAKFAGTMKEVNLSYLKLNILRNICHFIGQNLWFFALPIIPLAQLFALEFTAPIWVILFASLFLNESLTVKKIMIATLGFTGILIIARPELTTSNAGVIAGGLSAIGFAAAAILTRKLTVNNSLTKILFYLTSSQIIFGLLCAGIDNKIQVPAKSNLLPLFVIGVTGLAAHFCMTKSLTLAPASIVMPIDFARLPLIAIIGMLFYNEILDPYVILGASLILAANLINLRQTK